MAYQQHAKKARKSVGQSTSRSRRCRLTAKEETTVESQEDQVLIMSAEQASEAVKDTIRTAVVEREPGPSGLQQKEIVVESSEFVEQDLERNSAM